jgi:hypothetical protein
MKTTSLFLLLAFFISGCGLFAAPVSKPSPAVQRPIIVVITEVVAPTETEWPTPTPAVWLTETAAAAWQPLEATPTPVVWLTETAAWATPTPVYWQTETAATAWQASSTPTYTPWTITNGAQEWGVSPDQTWVWALKSGSQSDGREFLTTHLARQGKRTEWLIQPGPGDPGRPKGTKNLLRPLFWMPNEPYVFLAGESCCAEEPVFFSNGLSLYRLNLETGKFSMISPWGPPTYFSFSPGAKYQLIASNGTSLVSVTRLQDSHKVQIPVPGSFVSVGNALWAPDGNHVLLRACNEAQNNSCRKTPLIVVDPENTEFQTMVSDLYQALEMAQGDQEQISWDDNQHVRLTGPKYSLVFDVVTGKLEKRK